MVAIETIRTDLKPFADPATELVIKSGSTSARIQIVRNGIALDYLLDHDTGRITARHDRDRAYINLSSLLASTDFAVLRAMAETQERIFREFSIEKLIPPEGSIDGQHLTLGALWSTVVPGPSNPESADRLKIVLLDGPAGVGKTHLIQRLLVQCARDFRKQGNRAPILHVRSRGRRLAGLNDALAQSIQLIRARYTFDQVPVLVRHNLLQVAIDGFDELVDPDGYKDAWFALRDFFGDVGFGRPIILAGRDTFFNEQAFKRRVKELSPKAEVTHINLHPVRPKTAKDWLRGRGWSDKELNRPETTEVFRPGAYTLRPFFLSELATVRGWSSLEASGMSPRAYLIERFIGREAKIIQKDLPAKKSVVRGCLRKVFTEVAVEMADNETENVDISFLQLAVEFAFSEHVAKEDIAKLRHKAGSLALLEVDIREDRRRFPHTEISHHFLSHGLVNFIGDGVYPRVLRRGLFTIDFLIVFDEVFSSLDIGVAKSVVMALERHLDQEVSFDRAHENVGALLVATLSRNLGLKRKYSGFNLTEASVTGSPFGTLSECVVIRFNMREADATGISFDRTEVATLIVDPTTRFGNSRPHTRHLQIYEPDGVRDVYEPDEITRWIAQHTVETVENAEEQEDDAIAVKLLEKVCRRMLRHFYIKDDTSDPDGVLLSGDTWAQIEEILNRENRIRRTRKDASGRGAWFVHVIGAAEMLERPYKNSDIERIWREVAALG